VCRYKTALNCLLFFSIFSFLQLIVMFGARDEPLIWTSPGLLWIVYDYLQESTANLIAMIIPAVYLALYFLSRQKREFMAVAAIFFAVDTIALYVFAINWGLSDFDLIELGVPIVILSFLIRGLIAWVRLRGVSCAEYNHLKSIVAQERKARRRSGGGYYIGGYRGGGGGFGG